MTDLRQALRERETVSELASVDVKDDCIAGSSRTRQRRYGTDMGDDNTDIGRSEAQPARGGRTTEPRANAVTSMTGQLDTGDPQERYILAVTIAGASDDPTESDYAAWDRVREIATLAGVPALPPLLPPGLRRVLRAALLGGDGVLAGWEPDSLDEALHLAARAESSVLATLVACLTASGLAPDPDTVRAARLTAGQWDEGETVTEAERACARLLLPDLAHAITDGAMLG